MRTLSIEKLQVASQSPMQRRHRRMIVQIHIFVLHAPPQPLDEHVVQRPAFAVHADAHSRRLQPAREHSACELGSLIRIENLRLPSLQRFVQNLHPTTALPPLRHPPPTLPPPQPPPHSP